MYVNDQTERNYKRYKEVYMINTKFLQNISKIHSRYTEEFGPLIYGLISSIKPQVIIETGTCQGYITAWIALASLTIPNFKFYSIDWYRESWPHASQGSWKNVENNLRACGVWHGVSKLIVGEAIETLNELKSDGLLKNLGFVILDDWHTYHHLRTEIDIVYPSLVAGGYILVHDTSHDAMPEIVNAVNDSIAYYCMKNIWLFRSLGYAILQKTW